MSKKDVPTPVGHIFIFWTSTIVYRPGGCEILNFVKDCRVWTSFLLLSTHFLSMKQFTKSIFIE